LPDFDDIRRGIAALLRTALPADEGHVDAYFRDSPPVPALQVVGPREMERIDYGTGRRWLIAVEGCFGLTNEVMAQKKLDALIEPVADAVESDTTTTGALFSRLQDDGTILTAQAAAAQSVAFVRLEQPSKQQTETEADRLLVASWLFEVLS